MIGLREDWLYCAIDLPLKDKRIEVWDGAFKARQDVEFDGKLWFIRSIDVTLNQMEPQRNRVRFQLERPA